MSSSSTLALAELRDGPLYRFADWPNPEVPNGRIGVYTVWGGDELIYVGMGGRAVGPSADTNGPASTKLTGLSLQQIQDAARGQLSLDGLTRQLIRQSLCYRFTLVGQQLMTAANTAAKPLDKARPGLTAVECRPSADRRGRFWTTPPTPTDL